MSISAAVHEAPHMSSHFFDTLAYAKKMKAVGFTEEQAETQAEGMAELIDEKLATKQDIKDLEKFTKQDIKDVKNEIRKVEQQLRHEIQEVTYKLTIRLGGMLITGVTVLAILIKLL